MVDEVGMVIYIPLWYLLIVFLPDPVVDLLLFTFHYGIY